MNNQPQPVCYDEDEIDLRELLRTILRYKTFIILFTLIVTLAAAGYVFLKKPKYQASASIQIGRINNSMKIFPDNKNIGCNTYILIPSDIPALLKPFGVSATIEKRTKAILDISALSSITGDALTKVKKAVEFLLEEDRKKRDLLIENLQKQSKLLQTTRSELEDNLKALQVKHSRVTSVTDFTALIDVESRLKREKLKISQQIDRINLQIEKNKIDTTKIITPPKEHIVYPKRKLIVVVAFITGLILSIFLVFFFEFVKSMKEEKES